LLGGESEDALRLEHGVRHLAFGQVWAEFSKYPILHLLTTSKQSSECKLQSWYVPIDFSYTIL